MAATKREPTRKIPLTENEITFLRQAAEEITIKGRTSRLVADLLDKLEPMTPAD